MWEMGQIALIAAICSFGLGGVTVILSGLGCGTCAESTRPKLFGGEASAATPTPVPADPHGPPAGSSGGAVVVRLLGPGVPSGPHPPAQPPPSHDPGSQQVSRVVAPPFAPWITLEP